MNIRILIISLLLTPVLLIRPASAQDSIIDGVVAIVGANVILKSDIENNYLQIRSQGDIRGSSTSVKCEIMDNLLFQKLLVHQAAVDSVKVTDVQVESEMDRRMRYFISMAGSPDKLEQMYNKSIVEIKNELRDVIREQILAQTVQEKITKDVDVNPNEVKSFFRKIPKDSIPEVAAEYEIGVIVKKPDIGDAERLDAVNRLKGFKERIQKGDDFATLAVLYSEDPGSAKQGGELGMFKRGDMRPEFEAAAFKLKPGEVSDIVETEDGYHLIQMIERRGEYINVRHILLQPKVSVVNLNKAKTFLDSVANLIETKKMTFDVAVIKFSDDPTKNSGGMMINSTTGGTRFEASQLDPKVFFVVDKLKVGDISAAVLMKTERQKDELRIYYLKTRTTPHKASIDADYARIQQMALAVKKQKVINDWADQKIKLTFIQVNDEYRNCNFQRDWLKK